MKIKHNCEKCKKWAEYWKKRSEYYKKWSEKYANKCQCKKDDEVKNVSKRSE